MPGAAVRVLPFGKVRQALRHDQAEIFWVKREGCKALRRDHILLPALARARLPVAFLLLSGAGCSLAGPVSAPGVTYRHRA